MTAPFHTHPDYLVDLDARTERLREVQYARDMSGLPFGELHNDPDYLSDLDAQTERLHDDVNDYDIDDKSIGAKKGPVR